MTEYNTIQEVRFDTQISEKDISTILKALNESYHSKNDIRTRLEHNLVGGSCPFNGPLTPMAHIAGTMTPEEINAERVVHQVNGEPGEVHWLRGGNTLTASPETRQALYQIIHDTIGKPLFSDSSLDLHELSQLNFDVRYKDATCTAEQQQILDTYHSSGVSKILFWLGFAPMDLETGITGLPYVKRIETEDEHQNIKVPNKVRENITLVLPQEDSFFGVGLDIDGAIKAYIDEKGYQFKLEEDA